MLRAFLLLAVFGSIGFSFQAQADSFTVIRDGQEYLCQATSSNPGGVIDCADKAYKGPFSRDEAARLCSGATSTAPADCAIEAYKGSPSKDEAVQLCRGARSMGPADCFKTAYSGPFSKEQSLQLCSRDGDQARAQCAIKAYQGPYSKDEAIRLCKGGDARLLMRSFLLMESSPEIQGKIFQIKTRLNLTEKNTKAQDI